MPAIALSRFLAAGFLCLGRHATLHRSAFDDRGLAMLQGAGRLSRVRLSSPGPSRVHVAKDRLPPP